MQQGKWCGYCRRYVELAKLVRHERSQVHLLNVRMGGAPKPEPRNGEVRRAHL